MTSILAFIVTIGLLVTIHEYGHFIVARWFDVKVLRFSIGFGQPLLKRNFGKDNTEFVVAAIPLGGYVKMLDESEDDGEVAYSDADLSRAYNRQHVLKRMAIVLAGPISNLLLAILIYWAIFFTGVDGLKPYVGNVQESTPAAMAGLKQGDLLTQINQKPVLSWQEVRWHILQASGDKQPLLLQVLDEGNQAHQHKLMLSTLDPNNADEDPLKQLGLTVDQPKLPAVIGRLLDDAPAKNAGLQPFDKILSVNDKPITRWIDFVTVVQASAERPMTVLVERDGVRKSLNLIPQAHSIKGKVIGKIGAGVDYPESIKNKYNITLRYSVAESLSRAINKTWETSLFSLKMLGRMLTGDVSWKMISGPVTIADYAGQSANIGLKAFVSFLALISISLGVLNLLPIPMLDGGHFMYYVIEILSGKPVSQSTMIAGQKIGLALIGTMMLLAFYNDINRLVSG